MKTLFAMLAGASLAIGSYFGVAWVNTPSPDPEPPTPAAQKLINSMLNGHGWRMGRKDCVIVHLESEIVVHKCGKVETSGDQEVDSFTKSDKYWFKKHF